MQLSTGKPLLAVLLMLVTPLAWAADPLAGNWLLKHQDGVQHYFHQLAVDRKL